MFKRITSFIITLILIISAVGMGLKPIPANAKTTKFQRTRWLSIRNSV